MSDAKQREDKALDALIAGALLPELKTEKLTDAQLDALLAAPYTSLPEDKALLQKRGNPFAAGLAKNTSAWTALPSVVDEALAMAMNRKNAADKQSDQTRAEMERKKKELLG